MLDIKEKLIIRHEKSGDQSTIRSILIEVFGQASEADLVVRIEKRNAHILSLVAVIDEKVVGHILFTPITVNVGGEVPRGVALGPLSVSPSHHGKGIGSALSKQGLDICREMGYEIAIVYGHPSYYPKFGFKLMAECDFSVLRDIPKEKCLIAELKEGILKGKQGTVQYLPDFNKL